MSITELLTAMDMGNVDPAEQERRIEHALHAMSHGCEIRGVIDGRITAIGMTPSGEYLITQQWTIRQDACVTVISTKINPTEE